MSAREGTPSPRPDYDTAYFCPEHAPEGANPQCCWKCSKRLAAHVHHNPDAHDALLEALRRIADEESGWRFKVDPLEHARSVVEEMREVARAAIAAAEGERDG